MIIDRGLHLRRLVHHLGPLLAAMLVYDLFITLLYLWGHRPSWLALDNLPLPLLGSAVALVVTLRNNAAYARWWEARGLWGLVVNDSRSLVRGLLAMVDDRRLHADVAHAQIAYTQALRCHLLRIPPWDDVAPHLPQSEIAALRGANNVPLAVQSGIARRLAGARGAGTLDAISLAALNATLSALANAQGGLERIKNTPLPRQYNQFPRIFTRVYCVLLPIGLVQDLRWFTPLGSAIVGFMFLALDRIGADLEDPFEGTVHDIPMAAITRSISIDLQQMAGKLPEVVQVTASDGVLP